MEIIRFVADCMACIYDAGLILWFLYRLFSWKREMKLWWITPFFVVLCFTGFFLGDYLFLQLLFLIFIPLLYESLFLKGNLFGHFVGLLILLTAYTLTNALVSQVIPFLSGDSIEALMRLDRVESILMILVDKMTLLVVLRSITHFYHMDEMMTSEVRFVTLTLYLTSLLTAVISINVVMTLEDSTQLQLEMIILNLAQIGVMVIIRLMLAQIEQKRMIEQENSLLNLQLAEQQKQLLQTEELYQKTRKMRHDMRRYFTTYRNLLEQGKVDAVIDDLQKTLEERLPARQIVYTDNEMINAIINGKQEKCKELGIEFDVQITEELKEEHGIDFAVILSNLLDNAIEAEEKVKQKEKRKIILQIFSYKKLMNVLVRNYIEESVLEENPHLKTTKDNRFRHGIGVRSVKEMVRTMGGRTQFVEEEHFFVAHIII